MCPATAVISPGSRHWFDQCSPTRETGLPIEHHQVSTGVYEGIKGAKILFQGTRFADLVSFLKGTRVADFDSFFKGTRVADLVPFLKS